MMPKFRIKIDSFTADIPVNTAQIDLQSFLFSESAPVLFRMGVPGLFQQCFFAFPDVTLTKFDAPIKG
jgi:hypothetical protein